MHFVACICTGVGAVSEDKNAPWNNSFPFWKMSDMPG